MTMPQEPMAGIERGEHWQWRVERSMRRWGLACMGCLVGSVLVLQLHQHEMDMHRQVAQEVARLELQLAALPASQTGQTLLPFPAEFTDKLASLPEGDEPAPIWTALHQALERQGLQWLSLRPVPPTAKPEASVRWPSHAVVVRVKGRFEDWVKAWETLAEIGVLCSIDKIGIAATAVPAEVQIDVILRVWMRPIGMRESPQAGGAWQMFAQSSVDPASKRPPAEKWPLLFAQAPIESAGPASSGAGLSDPALDKEGVTVPAVALSQDPHQWPLSRVRLVGLLQQGDSRQAILTAGGHWARVSQGQRVTQEGHRVVAITDAGVSLRLAQGAQFALDWDDGRSELKQGINK
jgi:Tfp pilus assembly protein PilP